MADLDTLVSEFKAEGVVAEHITAVLSYFSGSDFDRVVEAYRFAHYYLKETLRKDGSSFFAHMVESAYILHTEIRPELEKNTGIRLSAEDYIAIIIHDVHEKSKAVTLGEGDGMLSIKDIFGEEVSVRVRATHTIGHGPSARRDNYARITRTQILIPSAAAIKLADVMHNIRTLDGHSDNPYKQLTIALSAYVDYAQIAHDLGLNIFAEEMRKAADLYIQGNKSAMRRLTNAGGTRRYELAALTEAWQIAIDDCQ
ncbi:MAG: HD domain-containing protein [Candidatus Woesearchaeota archaeon]